MTGFFDRLSGASRRLCSSKKVHIGRTFSADRSRRALPDGERSPAFLCMEKGRNIEDFSSVAARYLIPMASSAIWTVLVAAPLRT